MAEHLSEVGISNRERPQEEERKRREHPVQQEGGAPEPDATELEARDVQMQTSMKRGSKASAQKEASTRHTDRPAPSSNKVQGAFGKESDRG